ncbi:MAG: Anamorsin, variant 2 [Marteilia pararefringens]
MLSESCKLRDVSVINFIDFSKLLFKSESDVSCFLLTSNEDYKAIMKLISNASYPDHKFDLLNLNIYESEETFDQQQLISEKLLKYSNTDLKLKIVDPSGYYVIYFHEEKLLGKKSKNYEDILLEEDFEKPQYDKSSCSVNFSERKRKPCANCSCGAMAKEISNQVSKTENSTSSCGNCYKGDAFRCSTCPHMGKPPFEEGQRITIDDI